MENFIHISCSTGEEFEMPVTEELAQAVEHMTNGDGVLAEMTDAWKTIFRQCDCLADVLLSPSSVGVP